MSARNNDRPTKGQDRSNRPERIRLGAQRRDIITVKGQNPDYVYYWALDESDQGKNIAQMKLAGWDFEFADNVTVGQTHVYEIENVGSIVRVSAGDHDDRYLYLMKKPKEWDEEDRSTAQDELDAAESAMQVNISSRRPDESGSYGKVAFNNNMRVRRN